MACHKQTRDNNNYFFIFDTFSKYDDIPFKSPASRTRLQKQALLKHSHEKNRPQLIQRSSIIRNARHNSRAQVTPGLKKRTRAALLYIVKPVELQPPGLFLDPARYILASRWKYKSAKISGD